MLCHHLLGSVTSLLLAIDGWQTHVRCVLYDDHYALYCTDAMAWILQPVALLRTRTAPCSKHLIPESTSHIPTHPMVRGDVTSVYQPEHV